MTEPTECKYCNETHPPLPDGVHITAQHDGYNRAWWGLVIDTNYVPYKSGAVGVIHDTGFCATGRDAEKLAIHDFYAQNLARFLTKEN